MLRRYTLLSAVLILVLLLVSAVSYVPVSADNVTAWTTGNTNLRSGPGTKYTVLGTLAPGTAVILEGRNATLSWLLVHLQSDVTQRGWANTYYLKVSGIKLSSLPVSIEIVGLDGKPITGDPSAASIKPSSDGTGADDSVIPPYTLPVPPLPNNIPTGAINAPILPQITGRIRTLMRAVYLKGRSMGNNPHAFAKVGDCHTDHPAFFEQIGTGKYDLGRYGYLQGVVDYFMGSPRTGVANSFIEHSQAAHSAFNAGAVLDWRTSDPTVCLANESPLRCEYRLDKPAVAIIMFGVVDLEVMSAPQFNLYMRYIVKDTLDRGIIPLLSTEGENTANLGKARQFNQIVVAIAREKGLPLINLEAALEPLPSRGMDADGIHLTRPADVAQTGFFNDQNLQFGYTTRNLVTLQALDEVVRQIMN